MEIQVQHEDGAFFVVDERGKRVAEQTYKRLGASLINVNHTGVDPSLQGQGVARRLLDALVAWARQSGTRVHATCPYAKAQFEKDASIRDVYDA